MAIQQQVSVILELLPDGTSNAFQFDIGSLFGLHVPDVFSGSGSERWPFVLFDKSIPVDSVAISSVFQGGSSISGVTASILRRTITITFPSAPSTSAVVQVTLNLNFNG